MPFEEIAPKAYVAVPIADDAMTIAVRRSLRRKGKEQQFTLVLRIGAGLVKKLGMPSWAGVKLLFGTGADAGRMRMAAAPAGTPAWKARVSSRSGIATVMLGRWPDWLVIDHLAPDFAVPVVAEFQVTAGAREGTGQYASITLPASLVRTRDVPAAKVALRSEARG